jgi:hypothetical protein
MFSRLNCLLLIIKWFFSQEFDSFLISKNVY